MVVADDMNLSVVAEARTRKTPTPPAAGFGGIVRKNKYQKKVGSSNNQGYNNSQNGHPQIVYQVTIQGDVRAPMCIAWSRDKKKLINSGKTLEKPLSVRMPAMMRRKRKN